MEKIKRPSQGETVSGSIFWVNRQVSLYNFLSSFVYELQGRKSTFLQKTRLRRKEQKEGKKVLESTNLVPASYLAQKDPRISQVTLRWKKVGPNGNVNKTSCCLR